MRETTIAGLESIKEGEDIWWLCTSEPLGRYKTLYLSTPPGSQALRVREAPDFLMHGHGGVPIPCWRELVTLRVRERLWGAPGPTEFDRLWRSVWGRLSLRLTGAVSDQSVVRG